MQYFTLLRGRSKDKLKPVMIDSLRKVENYRKSLEASDVKTWHYDVQPAGKDCKPWRKSSSSQWTNYNSPHVPLVRNGSTGNRG